MSNPSNITILNPFTPMAFLSPERAFEETITQYVIVGGLSVLIWDILTHLYSDYKLVTQYRVALPTIVYFLSRWSTLLYSVLTTVFQTAPVDNCLILSKVTCAVYHVTVSSTALLFFLRVRAIFAQNIYITVGFLFLWVTVLGGSLTSVLSLSGAHIGATKYCTFSHFESYRSAANITLATFDTCVFIAITWRLSYSQLSILKNEPSSSERRMDIFGKYLPAFSRGLLHDGQKYYMAATFANLLVLIMTFAPGIPIPYRSMFLAPANGLTNIMACRVFRHTKMGYDTGDTHTVSKMVFEKSDGASLFARPSRAQRDGSGLTTSFITETPNSSATETKVHLKESQPHRTGHIYGETKVANSIM